MDTGTANTHYQQWLGLTTEKEEKGTLLRKLGRRKMTKN